MTEPHPHTIDITPDADGLVRWARTVLRQSEPDSEAARVAHTVLAECGVTEGNP